jgi:hypothetical protein
MNTSDLITLVCLTLYLPLVLFVHAAWYRVAPELKQGHAQGPAIKVTGFVAVAMLVVLAVLLPRDGEWLSHLAFAVLALASLVTFYFTFFCISESGRRYYMVALLAGNPPGLTREALAQHYGKDYMVDVRLARLLSWGVIQESQGKLILRKWSFYGYSAFCYYWARLLRFNWF